MKTYSLNLIAYLKTRGFNVSIATEDGYKFYGLIDDSQELTQATKDYKADTALHDYLEKFKQLREEINDMRASS